MTLKTELVSPLDSILTKRKKILKGQKKKLKKRRLKRKSSTKKGRVVIKTRKPRGWNSSSSSKKRREDTAEAYKGDYKEAARDLVLYSQEVSDEDVASKALRDGKYLYSMYKSGG
jgi:hypothetical protein